MPLSSEQTKITSGQKMGVLFLSIFCILAVGMAFFQFKTAIYGPFALRNKSGGVEQAQIVLDETIRLQRIDTDQDGLNDFEELHFYETSPYLPDTDSDNRSDKKEVDEGTDPLCPQGEICAGAPAAISGSGESDVKIGGLGEVFEPPQEGASPDLQALLGDPIKLRELLASSGNISEEELKGISDEELIAITEQSLKQANAAKQANPVAGSVPPPAPSSSAAPSAGVTSPDMDTLAKDPTALRKLLASSGKISEEELKKIDDATLLELAKSILKQ